MKRDQSYYCIQQIKDCRSPKSTQWILPSTNWEGFFTLANLFDRPFVTWCGFFGWWRWSWSCEPRGWNGFGSRVGRSPSYFYLIETDDAFYLLLDSGPSIRPSTPPLKAMTMAWLVHGWDTWASLRWHCSSASNANLQKSKRTAHFLLTFLFFPLRLLLIFKITH